ncbi:MAG: type IV secretion protein Rhs [Acidobacteriota bacterium]
MSNAPACLLLLACLAQAAPALAQKQDIYDANGLYQGRVDKDGRTYDRNGNYVGRTGEDGKAYDRYGNYKGRIDGQGRSYDSTGAYTGRIDKKGDIFTRDETRIGKSRPKP